jgi:hypothetical protein
MPVHGQRRKRLVAFQYSLNCFPRSRKRRVVQCTFAIHGCVARSDQQRIALPQWHLQPFG